MGALAEHCAFDINIVAEPCRKKFGREAAAWRGLAWWRMDKKLTNCWGRLIHERTWDDGWWWWIELIQLICLFFTFVVVSYMFCFWLKQPKRCSVSVSQIWTDLSCRLFLRVWHQPLPSLPPVTREEFQKGFDFLMDSLEYLGFTRILDWAWHVFPSFFAQYGGVERVRFFWHLPLCDP